MIRHPERVKAERLRPLSEGEEVCPARGLASHGAFDGRQVNANFERAQGPRRPIHTCLGGPSSQLVISHDDSPYLLLYYMSRPCPVLGGVYERRARPKPDQAPARSPSR